MAAFTGAEWYFCASHRPVDGGPLHGHTWRVRVFWSFDGTDADERQQQLKNMIAPLDHSELPSNMSRAESMAVRIGSALDAVECHVWREPEGLYAKWIAT